MLIVQSQNTSQFIRIKSLLSVRSEISFRVSLSPQTIKDKIESTLSGSFADRFEPLNFSKEGFLHQKLFASAEKLVQLHSNSF